MSENKINSMCENCQQRGNGCGGTTCQTWTGCVRRKPFETICQPRISYTPNSENGHPYNVQLWHSYDGGKTFVYAGCGKFFKDYYEAEAYRKQHRQNLAYDLMFGCLGNGITVCNRAREVGGDYPTVAHIDNCGAISYYMDETKLPEYARREINSHAGAQAINFKHGFLHLPKAAALEMLYDILKIEQLRLVFRDRDYAGISREEIYNSYIEYTCLNEKRTMPTL